MSARPKEDLRVKEVPDIVVDPSSKKRYLKGRFLGKGGFAKCYELTDTDTKKIYAGKIVSKQLLVKPHQKDKMTMEIAIHRAVHHKHVVGFHGFFEDDQNVYVLLELCRRRSLMELHKRRKAITEPETRYFMRQIILAMQYLHKTKVIHRDLKLGNLFINDEMEVKIGDFGLATKVDYDGERKKTLCGTPNYIAPEVLSKRGHSYEVDIWSLGCIMFTMLVGKPPFETTSLKDTYTRIKRNEYHVPSAIKPSARALIKKLLQHDPSKRPTIHDLLDDEFFTLGHLPQRLPTSCLTMAPRFAPQSSRRPPLSEVNSNSEESKQIVPSKPVHQQQPADIGRENATRDTRPSSDQPQLPAPTIDDEDDKPDELITPKDYFLANLFEQLDSVVQTRPSELPNPRIEETLDPAAVPVLWISKWVDYSDKYGLGYQLCDGSVGVLFNDTTRLLLQSDIESIEYIERDGKEHFHTLSKYPESLHKKVTLLKYFRNYMSEHLLKAGAAMAPRDGETISRLPFLKTWFRTRSAIVLHLSNGTLQINFFQDHTKIILCPLMGAVTYIDEGRNFSTFKLKLIETYGCTHEIGSRLRYARTMVERLRTGKTRVKSGQPAAH